MPCNISLNQPFLEQQSVQEMLSLPSEKADPKVSLEEWIKIAVMLIKAELADCDYDEDELLSFRLAYAVPHPTKADVKEIYDTEWKTSQTQSVQASAKGVESESLHDAVEGEPEDFNQTLPVSPEFLERLVQRLHEGIFATLPGLTGESIVSWDFKSSECPPGYTCPCDGECTEGNNIYVTIRKDGIKVDCGAWCRSKTERFPDS